MKPVAAGDHQNGSFFEYGRMGVQVFLVGGDSCRPFAPDGVPVLSRPLNWSGPYCPPDAPFLLAMLLAIAAPRASGCRTKRFPGARICWRFVAHGLLLHVVRRPPLSVGVWYVAIGPVVRAAASDVGLPCVLAGHHPGNACLASGWSVCSASPCAVSFQPDALAGCLGIYFFGSYALGAMSYWLPAPGRPTRCMLILGAVGAAALLVDFRPRIALALVTAMLRLAVLAAYCRLAEQRSALPRRADFVLGLSQALPGLPRRQRALRAVYRRNASPPSRRFCSPGRPVRWPAIISIANVEAAAGAGGRRSARRRCSPSALVVRGAKTPETATSFIWWPKT